MARGRWFEHGELRRRIAALRDATDAASVRPSWRCLCQRLQRSGDPAEPVALPASPNISLGTG